MVFEPVNTRQAIPSEKTIVHRMDAWELNYEYLTRNRLHEETNRQKHTEEIEERTYTTGILSEARTKL